MPAPWPHTFAALAGDEPASFLDDNFNAAAQQADLLVVEADVAALPANDVPLIPVAGGAVGASAQLAREDHQHPPQAPTPNFQTGTSYSMLATDDGKVVDITNAAGIALTFTAANLQGYYSGLICQAGVGQITMTAGVGTTLRQASSLTKTRARYSVVSWYVRSFGAGAVEIVLQGDMA